MSYHRFPAYDWDRIIRVSLLEADSIKDPYTIEILSYLHKELGKPENLDMHYTITKDGSAAYSENVPRTFRAFGYRCGELEDYSFDKIKGEVYAQRPVYIDGYSIKEVTTTPKFLFWGGDVVVSYKKGHAWVIDGVRQIKRKVTTIHRITKEVVDIAYEVKELVHCNMGWKGTDSGYYISKAFDTNKGPVMKTLSPLRASTQEGAEYNYQFYHHIITHIQR